MMEGSFWGFYFIYFVFFFCLLFVGQMRVLAGGFLQGIEWSSTCAIAGTAIRHSPAHTHTHTHACAFLYSHATHPRFFSPFLRL